MAPVSAFADTLESVISYVPAATSVTNASITESASGPSATLIPITPRAVTIVLVTVSMEIILRVARTFPPLSENKLNRHPSFRAFPYYKSHK